jgi:uncharacterized membrane protein
MAFCPNCGAQVTGTFCPNCGAAVTGAAPGGGTPPGATPGAGAGYAPPPQAVQSGGLSTNAASALCYLFGLLTGIIFLVIAPYNQNKTVRFHAFQSIFFNLAVMVFYFLWAFISLFLAVITHGFGFLLYPLFGLAIFILWLYLMFSAYNNKMVKLPLIGDWAAKQA